MFSKKQRKGIFLLLTFIVILQCVYFFVDFPLEDIQVNQEELSKFTKEIDSLKRLKIEESKPRIYPFNPNYITDYKGSVLGMSHKEIDRLLAFRKQNKWINSAQEFQDVTRVSDSLLAKIAIYFKYPEWLKKAKSKAGVTYSNNNKSKTYAQKEDLNTATIKALQKVSGVGKVLSGRIVKYRNKFKGGFVADVELNDVYGLEPEVIDRIINLFTVKTPRTIRKINLNIAEVDDLVTIPHIDYDLAYHIVEQRKLRAGYNTIKELIKVKDFPVNKIKIIELYLRLEKINK